MAIADQQPLRLVELSVSEIAGTDHLFPDLFNDLRTGRLQALLIHDVYSSSECAQIIKRVENADPGLLKTWFPEAFRSCFYGRNLNLTSPEQMYQYFEEAKLFSEQLDQVLPDQRGFTYLAQLLTRLDSGRPFVAAPGVRPNDCYMPTTLRQHLPGGYIPIHFDNEFMLRPSYTHLRSIAAGHIQSFVLALSEATDGGELEIFQHQAPPLGEQLLSDDHHPSQDMPDIQYVPSIKLKIPSGSMAVFDSGRYLHRLTEVQGQCDRWTLCSFMALASVGNVNYCWG